MDQDVAGALLCAIGKGAAGAADPGHQHEVVDEVGDPDACRHSHGHIGRDQQLIDGAGTEQPRGEQRQLIDHHQEVALVGIEAEHTGADLSRPGQGGVDHQTHRAHRGNYQGGERIDSHRFISFRRAISAA